MQERWVKMANVLIQPLAPVTGRQKEQIINALPGRGRENPSGGLRAGISDLSGRCHRRCWCVPRAPDHDSNTVFSSNVRGLAGPAFRRAGSTTPIDDRSPSCFSHLQASELVVKRTIFWPLWRSIFWSRRSYPHETCSFSSMHAAYVVHSFSTFDLRVLEGRRSLRE